MARKQKIVGGYVRVELRDPNDFGSFTWNDFSRSEKRIIRDLEALAEVISRKISKLDDDRGHVAVEYQKEDVCEHCGQEWTADGDTYNGGCCAADEQALVAAE